MKTSKNGELYVVATPIGNLEDISRRAIDVLGSVDLIAAEDTRRTRILLQHYAISTPMQALHEHNEVAQTRRLLDRLQRGACLALVSDAGTPLISDPGYRLVVAAHESGIIPVPVPGPSALTCMLSVCGQPADRFVFEGFLPSRDAARRSRLQALAAEPRTLVFYESSHRILDALDDMVRVFGEQRSCTVGRELTKRFETLYRGGLHEVMQQLASDEHATRGEFVVVVQGQPGEQKELEQEGRRIMDVLLEELSISQASSLAARLTGMRKKQLYEYALHRQQR
jgi:16S rRNA (cytidine1402-2'-O)-methyltransferase